MIPIERPGEARGRPTFRSQPALASLRASPDAPSEQRAFVHKKLGRLAKKAAAKLARGAIGSIPIVGGFAQQFLPQGGPALPAIPERLQFLPPRFQAPSMTPVQLPPTPLLTTPGERSVGPEFQAVQGAFGLAAMAPFAETRVHLDCPKGMVLGRDNLCYPKQVLRRNSKFRKWRSGPKPPVSAADAKMIRRLGAARSAVIKLAEGVDLVTKKKVNPK